jgi:DNA-binding XRE family transcriptional regulator
MIALEGAVIFQFVGVRSVADGQRVSHYLGRVETDIPRLLLAASMKTPPPAKAPTVKRFPDRLRELRKANGWSQQDVARRAGLSGTTVCFYETGRTEPKMTALVQLARAFDISIDQLIGFAPEGKA